MHLLLSMERFFFSLSMDRMHGRGCIREGYPSHFISFYFILIDYYFLQLSPIGIVWHGIALDDRTNKYQSNSSPNIHQFRSLTTTKLSHPTFLRTRTLCGSGFHPTSV